MTYRRRHDEEADELPRRSRYTEDMDDDKSSRAPATRYLAPSNTRAPYSGGDDQGQGLALTASRLAIRDQAGTDEPAATSAARAHHQQVQPVRGPSLTPIPVPFTSTSTRLPPIIRLGDDGDASHRYRRDDRSGRDASASASVSVSLSISGSTNANADTNANTGTRGSVPPPRSQAGTISHSERGGRAASQITTLTRKTETEVERLLTGFHVRPGFGTSGKPVEVISNFYQVRATGGKGKIIHHYDVEIDPVVRVTNQKKPKGVLRAVWEQLVLEQTGVWAAALAASAFDGRKNCYSPIEFPIPTGKSHKFITAVRPDGQVHIRGQDSSASETPSDEDNRRWSVMIKHVALVDLETVIKYCKPNEGRPEQEEECQTACMATNVLLRDLPSKKYAQVGANGKRFFGLDGAVPIRHGAVICKGFMQSFRHSSSGLPLLNLNTAFSAFLASGPALEVIAKVLSRGHAGGRGCGGGGGGGDGMGGPPGGYTGGIQRLPEINELDPKEISLIKHAIRGAKFTVTHRQSTRLHTVLSMTSRGAHEILFNLNGRNGEADRRISIPVFFQEYWGARVTKPRLPCIQYGAKSFIPLEFVRFEEWNPLPPTKLTPDQTADMIKISALGPKARLKTIQDWRTELAYERQEKLRAWGLEVNSKLIRCQARILPPPKVLYADNRTAQVDQGAWQLKGMRFFRGGKQPLITWAIVSFDRFTGQDEMKRYGIYMMDTLEKHGVHVVNRAPELVEPVDPRQPTNVLDSLRKAARAAYRAGKRYGAEGMNPQLICVVLPGRDAFLYEQIKRVTFTDLHKPVPTQCMQAAKIRSPNGIGAYTANLVMKILSKLGGVTHQIPVSELPGMVRGKTMLLGGDLGHPPSNRELENAPTVACTIATYNADCDSYSAQIRLQTDRKDIIQDLADMVEAHLRIFAKHNKGQLPERILIFRDGISEGQYAAALMYEKDAVIQACQRLDQGYRPKLLICVCAKNHNTRFFGNDRDVDRSGNLPAGLVVDRSVTHPFAFDFFVQAHQSRVGTARPTHYICLLDELAITPDQLQQMVNALCFGFARCTRSVSLVPVCYIADLVCAKARMMVHEPNSGTSYAPSQSTAGGGGRRDRGGGMVDVMQIQKVMAKNPDLQDVAWWM